MIVYVKSGPHFDAFAVQETIPDLDHLPASLARIKKVHPSIDRLGAIGLILEDGATTDKSPIHRFDVSTGNLIPAATVEHGEAGT
jgi:hypothetical protein